MSQARWVAQFSDACLSLYWGLVRHNCHFHDKLCLANFIASSFTKKKKLNKSLLFFVVNIEVISNGGSIIESSFLQKFHLCLPLNLWNSPFEKSYHYATVQCNLYFPRVGRIYKKKIVSSAFVPIILVVMSLKRIGWVIWSSFCFIGTENSDSVIFIMEYFQDSAIFWPDPLPHLLFF